MTYQKNTNHYNSLDEIRIRREFLAKDIDAEENKIKDLWTSLFAKEEISSHETPSKRVKRLLSTGAGLFDAALLGWKLYRKFSGKSLIPKFRRRR